MSRDINIIKDETTHVRKTFEVVYNHNGDHVKGHLNLDYKAKTFTFTPMIPEEIGEDGAERCEQYHKLVLKMIEYARKELEI